VGARIPSMDVRPLIEQIAFEERERKEIIVRETDAQIIKHVVKLQVQKSTSLPRIVIEQVVCTKRGDRWVESTLLRYPLESEVVRDIANALLELAEKADEAEREFIVKAHEEIRKRAERLRVNLEIGAKEDSKSSRRSK